MVVEHEYLWIVLTLVVALVVGRIIARWIF
jgi:hypothetical protein